MTLKELSALIPGSTLSGDAGTRIRGVSHDSRDVKPGDIFVCLVGEKFDGHRFAADAVARGASALCVQHGRGPLAAPLLSVEDTRRALPVVAAEVYGHPSRGLTLIGVTGTNGKTTSTLMMASILAAAGMRTGTIGTLGAQIDGEPLESERTTPEADQLQELLSEMRGRGARAVVMEVSSHALAQHRTDGCEFDGAIFTNLTQDHLDYHGSLDEYFESKLRLFRDYPAAGSKAFTASVNLDDPRGQAVASAAAGRVVTYGVESRADVRARDIRIEAGSVAFTAESASGELRIELQIGGAFQVYNALGAAAFALGIGIEPDAITAGLKSLKAVPGRFESVPTGRGFDVVVDYAHSPDGIENLLDSARKLNPNRIVTGFGCGGDRDRTKRPIMGRLAAERSDVVVVTSDNPRTEHPQSIIDEIMGGLKNAHAAVKVEPDRREAIRLALSEARPGDLVVIAGKGHEDYQEINGVKYPFDDRKVVRSILAGEEKEERGVVDSAASAEPSNR